MAENKEVKTVEKKEGEKAGAKKVPTSFELGIISTRIFDIFATMAKDENAANFRRRTLEEKNPAMGYFWATLNNQNFAIETKQPLFIEPNKHHGKPQSDWDNAAKTKIQLHDESLSMEEMRKIIYAKKSLYDASTSLKGGTAENKMRYAGSATESGTFIHDILGDVCIKNACRVDPMFAGNEKMFTHILPGRLWSPNFFPIATTPDGFTVGDQDKFMKLVELMAKHDPRLPLTPEIEELIDNGGAPFYIHEIKTTQTGKGGHKGSGSKIDRCEIEQLYRRYKREGPTEEFKAHVLSFIFEYCVDGGKTSADDITRSGLKRRIGDDHESPAKKKKKEKGAVTKHDYAIIDRDHSQKGLFSCTRDIAVRNAYDYSKIKVLTGDVVPYLQDNSVYRVVDQSHPKYNTEVNHNTPCKNKEIVKDAKFMMAKPVLNREKRCVIIFYEHTTNPIDKEANGKKFENLDCKTSEQQVVELFSLEFDLSPFALSTNGAFKRQTLAQMATCKHLNNKLQHIFSLIMSYNTSGNTIPAVQVSWNQNIHHQIVDMYVMQTANKLSMGDKIYKETFKVHSLADAVSKTPRGITMSKYIAAKKEEEDESGLFDL